MNQSRLRFKSALKYCQQNEIKMRADSLARSMMNNDMTGFWKDVHKITNSKVPLATKVDGCVGDTNIAEMWKCHYKSLLNSVENKNCKKSVMLDINKQIKNSITITTFNILDALKNTSAIPEVRGTADIGWRSLFPLPFNPPRTHSRLYHHMCLRTDGQ